MTAALAASHKQPGQINIDDGFLQEKIREFENKIPEFEKAIVEAREKKESALALFGNNKCSEQDISSAQDECLALTGELEKSKEILENLTKQANDLSGEINKQRQKQDRAIKEVWSELGPSFTTQLQELKQDIHKAFAAHRRGLRPMFYREFLLSCFPEPSRAELDVFNPELEKTYQRALKQN